MIKLILAVDAGNAIGWKNGDLPWKLPADLARFKALTTGHVVVMGRKTFESLSRPNGLPNRRNIVITQRRDLASCNVDVLSSLDQVIQLSARVLTDVWIIGGAQLYKEALERDIVDELHLTQVHTNSGADVVLHDDLFSWKLWLLREANAGKHCVLHDMTHPDQPQSPSVTFLTFTRVRNESI